MKPTSTDTGPAPDVAKKPSTKERFTALLRDYGPVAFGVYFSIFLLCIAVFAFAIQAGLDTQALAGKLGIEVEGVGETAGTLFGAWVVTKAIQIPRIFATLVLTPMIRAHPPGGALGPALPGVEGVLSRLRPCLLTRRRVRSARPHSRLQRLYPGVYGLN